MMKWDNLHKGTLLCVGDIMLDTFVFGHIDRISPEAPIPVLSIHHTLSALGGVGNVARNSAALGCPTTLVTAMGEDAIGGQVIQALITCERVKPVFALEEGRKTPHKTRYMSLGQQLLRVDDESVLPADESITAFCLESVLGHLPEAHAVILSDYAKGLLTPELCQTIIHHAREQGKPVIVDPKGHIYAKYAGATLLTPNLKELRAATSNPCQTNEEISQAARHLMETLDLEAVLVTRSQEGMTLVTKSSVIHIPALTRDVFDVSGAGDTVIAALGVGLAGGLSLEDAARLANEAAGIAVSKAGTAVVTQEELSFQTPRKTKLHTLESIPQILSHWRRQGLRVGFTNGCFDLLHKGHIHIIREARATCDRLILAVNSDDSIQRLKGPERPIHDEHTRVTVLEALQDVDALIVFDQDTPLSLIEAIQPDVLIKGADYRIDQVVGATIVQKRGGQVVLIDLLPGNSTSLTVTKLSRSAA